MRTQIASELQNISTNGEMELWVMNSTYMYAKWFRSGMTPPTHAHMSTRAKDEIHFQISEFDAF